MRIAVPAETDPGEARVAATPETVKKYIGLGADVVVQSQAGVKSGVPDADYTAAGATIAADAGATIADADHHFARAPPEPIGPRRRQARRRRPRHRRSLWCDRGFATNRGDRRQPLRDGADAAHHPCPGDGRALEPSQSRRLSRRHRCRGGIRPRLSDDDDRRGHRAGGEDLHHGRRRRRPAGHRHGAAARRAS